MPTYQYACRSTDCGQEFELVQSFTDPSASECPTCAGPVRKVFSAVGVVFKGSGFYRTDSRNGSPATSATSASSGENGSSSASSSSAAPSSAAPSSAAPSSSPSSSSSSSGDSSSAPAAASA